MCSHNSAIYPDLCIPEKSTLRVIDEHKGSHPDGFAGVSIPGVYWEFYQTIF